MAKKKSSSASETTKKQPLCTCSDPYKCSCSNRPPRPSNGHKWDSESQAWVGKGHRQKGGVVALKQSVVVTEKGQTTIAPHQSLPSKLLADFCKREKRPEPRFTSLKCSHKLFKYQCTVPDGKKGERDLIFIPSHPCPNEEQAHEEAALLALLKLTPSLPHERKLPEPYRTTWLHNNVGTNISKNNAAASKKSSSDASKNSLEPAAVAGATQNLTSQTSYTSAAERRQQDEQKRQARNIKLYKQEAMRMANKDHPCFMSVAMRKRIETLLRGESLSWNETDDSELEDEIYDSNDEARSYVLERLQNEGFTTLQARKAYDAARGTNTANDDEDWEKIHDSCLQWLCIHLDEDQLPEGFNPSGQTLDVIVKASTTNANNKKRRDDIYTELLKLYGLTTNDNIEKILSAVAAASDDQSNNIDAIHRKLWDAFCFAARVANNNHESDGLDDAFIDTQGENIMAEEFEALSAIFSSDECSFVPTDQKQTVVTLKLPDSDFVQHVKLHTYVHQHHYPKTIRPMVFISAETWKGEGLGLQMELIKFLFELPLGEPMIYELYGFALNLVSNYTENNKRPPPSLIPKSEGVFIEEPKVSNIITNDSKTSGRSSRRPFRPREKSDFWSESPHIAMPAAANPSVSREISEGRKLLPAAKAKNEFLRIMKQSDEIGKRVCLVTGATGCGKSTQLPQFILEDQPGNAKIVVAQPRRLAATGVANRVAVERGEKAPGSESVGYAVRGDVKCNKNTRLLFCTTGVLLRQIQSEGALENITHIVVDECHERNLDTDILLGLLKILLPTLLHLKVILMSATMDADKFLTYYGKNTPQMHIPGFTHPVSDFSLEDVLGLTGYVPRLKGNGNKKGKYEKSKSFSPWGDSERSEEENDGLNEGNEASLEKDKQVKSTTVTEEAVPIQDLLKRMRENEIDYDLIAILIRYLVQNKSDEGSILVFLPGSPEIAKASDIIRKVTKGMLIELLALHGGLQPNEQNLVFRKAAAGFTKVILSTNVAETSITIPDCTCVVDTCREKQSSYDPVNRMPLLVEGYASLDSLKQRRGRAGRVRPGVYYQLISEKTRAKLSSHGVPEICRCVLDSAILSLLFIGVEDGKGSFLKIMLDVPPKDSVEASFFSLIKMKAIELRSDGHVSLTPLGMHLAGIPAPPSVGKLIVMGSILGCRTASLSIAAFMSLGRSPFMKIDTMQRYPSGGTKAEDPQGEIEKDEEELRKRAIIEERENILKIVGNSDHALIAYVFLKWKELEGKHQRNFCDALGLSNMGLRDMKQLVLQYDSSLRSIGFAAERESDANCKSWRVVRSCVVAALSPSQLVRVQRPIAKYHETLSGALEKDAEAKEVKLFVRTSGLDTKMNEENSNSSSIDAMKEERVFFHPSSSNFAVGKFSCPWFVYHDLVRTSKPFLRDATECSAYALLLFGGDIEVQASNNLILVDNWVCLSASTRIGALIGGIRRKLDDLLLAKVADPSLDITGSAEIKTVVKLLVGDGLDH